MHFVFIPYGKRSCVERLLREMEAQKHKLFMTKGEKKQFLWIDGQVRFLPFGVWEYVFPKEDRDKVLTTLIDRDNYNSKSLKFAIIKKALNLKKIPKFSRETKYLWIKDDVNIIPLGIREDTTIKDPKGYQFEGWEHEAL